jgi:hypothetical protein
MTSFRWAMRHGARILFVSALLILVINFSIYFFLQADAYGQALALTNRTESKLILFWGALAQALEYSVWPFLGACLLYRFDLNRKGNQA